MVNPNSWMGFRLTIAMCVLVMGHLCSSDTPSSKIYSKTVLQHVSPASMVFADDCPGAVGDNCTLPCQLRICSALASLYHVSNNMSDPWDREDGWNMTVQHSCKQLVTKAPSKGPVYCSWHGITCCDAASAGLEHCHLVGSISALRLAVNNLNVSLENPVFFQSLQTLHDCGLFSIDFENNNIIGSLTEDWGRLRHLRHINIGTTWATGTIPQGLKHMVNLTVLNLGNNWFHGALPDFLADFTQLRVLNLGSQFGGNNNSNLTGFVGTIPARIGNLTHLRELVLEANSLSGQLPAGLCRGDNGTLLVLSVRGNQLEGSAKEVEACINLVQLDLSHNRFSGSLPASSRWEQLATYTASYNNFTGSWPPALNDVRILEHLDVGHNALTGLLPTKVTLMSSLKTIKLSNNKFSGTVVEDIYFMPALAILDLSSNQFVGTTPESIGLAYSLTELDLSNNTGVTGMVPPQMGLLPRLQVVKLMQTSMSCAGIIQPYTVTTNRSCSDPKLCTTPQQFGNASTATQRCRPEVLLPCFLKFTDYALPREDNSNMRCKAILLKSSKRAQNDCAGSGPQQLGSQAATIPDKLTDRWSARWEVDPSYFQYQVCECLLGYAASWDATGTVLTCLPEQRVSQNRSIIIAVVVAATAVLAVAAVVWRQYLRTRPRWLRERLLQVKRSKGAPKASKPGDRVLVSILVTDVKDFSDLTRRYPELMNKAMAAHNNIMRKACHAHAGHVMDQEGDSWTVAFHDAEDAVAFSLQVQQALSAKVWGLQHQAPSEASQHRPPLGPHSTQASEPSASSSYDLMGSPPAAQQHAAAPASHGARSSLLGLRSLLPARAAGSDGHASSRPSSVGVRSQQSSFTSAHEQANAVPGDIELGLPHHLSGAASNTWAHVGVGSGCVLERDVLAAGSRGPQHGDAREQPYKQLNTATLGHAEPCSISDIAGDVRLSRDVQQQRQQQQQQHAPHHHQQQQAQQLPHQQQQEGALADGRLAQHVGQGLTSPPAAMGVLARTSSSGQGQGHLWAKPESASAGTGSRVSDRSSSLSWAQVQWPASRLYTAGSAFMQRLSRVVRGNLQGSLLQPMQPDAAGVHELRLLVRIGVATGYLHYGVSLDNSVVKERAKNFVSDVANGGQILLDDRTFRLIRHCLSALGTVDESGYDEKQLQQLLHAQVVAKIQRHVACGTGCFRRAAGNDSFTSHSREEAARDYDTDAIVVHMGAFSAPVTAPPPFTSDSKAQPVTSTSDDSTPSADDDSVDEPPPAPAVASTAAAAAAGVQKASARTRRAKRRAEADTGGKQQCMHLQLYSIAAPKMRQLPRHTAELQACTAWCQAVQLKPGWMQVQKDYFQAPGARHGDLVPSSQQDAHGFRPPLPAMTFVFAEVPAAHSLAPKHHKGELRALNKSIRRVMTRIMAELPGGDGYMCRCHEPDLKYMVAFESPVRAVQWCLLVQEALMYVDWPEFILDLPGFEPQLDPESGQLAFRGPRLRMGVSEGLPSSVLPDHMGRANYTGGAVNRAARFMDAAAHPGQVVCDLQFAQRCFEAWMHERTAALAAQPSWGSGLDALSPKSIPEAAEATDWGDPQISLMQLLALRSQSETSGHCRPATGPQGLRSRALHELWYQQQQLKQQQKEVHRRQLRHLQPPELVVDRIALESAASVTSGVATGTRHSGHGSRTGGKGYASSSAGRPAVATPEAPSCSFTRFSGLSAAAGAAAASSGPGHSSSTGAQVAAGAALGSTLEPVTASFIGNFSFKGSGVFDMVMLQHAALACRQFPQQAPKGKGARLSAASGQVTELPQVHLLVPSRVLAARDAVAACLTAERGL